MGKKKVQFYANDLFNIFAVLFFHVICNFDYFAKYANWAYFSKYFFEDLVLSHH